MPGAITKGPEQPVEGRDFVICQICRAQGLDLRKHIGRHDLDEQSYHAQFPDHPLVAETYVHLVNKTKRRKRRKAAGLTRIRDILPTVVEQLTKTE